MNVMYKTFLFLTYTNLLIHVIELYMCVCESNIILYFFFTYLTFSRHVLFSFIVRNAKCNSHYYVSSAGKIIRYKYLHRYMECFYRHQDFLERKNNQI